MESNSFRQEGPAIPLLHTLWVEPLVADGAPQWVCGAGDGGCCFSCRTACLPSSTSTSTESRGHPRTEKDFLIRSSSRRYAAPSAGCTMEKGWCHHSVCPFVCGFVSPVQFAVQVNTQVLWESLLSYILNACVIIIYLFLCLCVYVYNIIFFGGPL